MEKKRSHLLELAAADLAQQRPHLQALGVAALQLDHRLAAHVLELLRLIKRLLGALQIRVKQQAAQQATTRSVSCSERVLPAACVVAKSCLAGRRGLQGRCAEL